MSRDIGTELAFQIGRFITATAKGLAVAGAFLAIMLIGKDMSLPRQIAVSFIIGILATAVVLRHDD